MRRKILKSLVLFLVAIIFATSILSLESKAASSYGVRATSNEGTKHFYIVTYNKTPYVTLKQSKRQIEYYSSSPGKYVEKYKNLYGCYVIHYRKVTSYGTPIGSWKTKYWNHTQTYKLKLEKNSYYEIKVSCSESRTDAYLRKKAPKTFWGVSYRYRWPSNGFYWTIYTTKNCYSTRLK